MGTADPATAAGPLYVGIDAGTSGIRTCAVDAAGREQARTAEPLPPPEGEGPAPEQDPRRWWATLEATLDTLFQAIPATAVAGLAVDGTSSTVLLTDAGGEPVTRALMYNDQRARDEAERVAGVAPADSAAHGPSAGLAKLLHLLTRPEAAQARHGVHQADWLAGRLCGRTGVSDENNALKLGYDPVARRWPHWLAELDVPAALLPTVVEPGTRLGEVTPRWRRRFGLSSGTFVAAGTTDSVAAFVATGAGNVGEAVTSLGSTLVLKVVSARPVFAPPYGIYSHRLGARWLAGGASNAGGGVLVEHFTVAELDALTPTLTPDQPTGLDYYPLSRPGERFPVADPQLAPRLEPRPPGRAAFLQAILEGLAAIEAQGYRRLAELGAPYPSGVRTAGGGAVNAAWNRIRARALGVPVTVPKHTEAAYGTALIAARGLAGTA